MAIFGYLCWCQSIYDLSLPQATCDAKLKKNILLEFLLYRKSDNSFIIHMWFNFLLFTNNPYLHNIFLLGYVDCNISLLSFWKLIYNK